MKKIYTLIAAALACAGTASAQQLPNNIGTFDGTWEDCIPEGSSKAVGTQPIGWMASNVNKMGQTGIFISEDKDRTYPDDTNKKSIKMENLFVGFMTLGSTAPGYITLGDAWAYGDVEGVISGNDKSDGGSYGSINFTYTPDAISMFVKRGHGTDKPTEVASVLFYSWKGSTTSKVITGLSTAPIEKQMVDRDKDVLGIITDGVTKSDDFELISKSENYIEGNIDTWTQKVFPIEYKSNSTPEKINIIISSSDYFNRANLGKNNTLDVDDVTLVYYSTLSKLTIGGSEIALTADTYEYAGTGEMPTSEGDVVATTKSKFAETKVTLDTENSKVIITVTNQGGADLDGKTSHTYTITYPAATAEPKQYSGYLNVTMMNNKIVTDDYRSITIAENGNGTCTFTLPDFGLGGEKSFGDIVVENVTMTEADGITTYTGSTEGMVLVPNTITANVELAGTINADGVVDFDIDVVWVESNMPIDVTFTTEPQASTPAEPNEYNGYLNIKLGETAMPEQTATVEITDNGDGTCTFRLPNFNFQGTTLGDIVVENVTMTESEGTTTYQGSVKGLVLVPAADPAPGITADIELNGTIDANGIVDFKIDVMWLEASTPIYVTFTTNSLASVEGINAATAAVYGTTGAIAINGYTGMAQVYNMGGQLVASRIVDGDATIDVTAGIYIVRIDGTNVKVIVK